MSTDFNSSGLLQAIASGNGGGMSALIPQVLAAQLGDDDPTVSLLTGYFAQQAQREKDDGPSDTQHENLNSLDHASELKGAQERLSETQQAMHDLREKIEAVYAELEILRQRNDLLAIAFGACSLCWGEDLQCPVCGGDGQPGFVEPDHQLFMQFVAPAMRRFQSNRDAERTRTRQQVLNH